MLERLVDRVRGRQDDDVAVLLLRHTAGRHSADRPAPVRARGRRA